MDIPDKIMKNMVGNGRGNGGVVIGIMLSIFDVPENITSYTGVSQCAISVVCVTICLVF